MLNTHLFFHYMAPHIRTMHVWAMVQVRPGRPHTAHTARACGPAVPAATPAARATCCAPLTLCPLAAPQEAHAFIGEALADPALAQGALHGQRPALLFCGDLNSGEWWWRRQSPVQRAKPFVPLAPPHSGPALLTLSLPPAADLNDGIPGAIELLSKGSLHADFWDWW